jgi:hypothetical protein
MEILPFKNIYMYIYILLIWYFLLHGDRQNINLVNERCSHNEKPLQIRISISCDVVVYPPKHTQNF